MGAALEKSPLLTKTLDKDRTVQMEDLTSPPVKGKRVQRKPLDSSELLKRIQSKEKLPPAAVAEF